MSQSHQLVGQKRIDRKYHVFYFIQKRNVYKCVLCGAVCRVPPSYPDPPNWMPDYYEKVTEKEKQMCPPD